MKAIRGNGLVMLDPVHATVAPDDAFVAIDFETADHGPDSACAVGLVRVEGLTVVRRETVLLRPPRRHIIFTAIHGITWEMVEDKPPFVAAWPQLLSILDGAAFLAAHNASFDRRCSARCGTAAGLPMPTFSFLCTVQLARRHWGQKRNDLPPSAGGSALASSITMPAPMPRPCRIVIAARAGLSRGPC